MFSSTLHLESNTKPTTEPEGFLRPHLAYLFETKTEVSERVRVEGELEHESKVSRLFPTLALSLTLTLAPTMALALTFTLTELSTPSPKQNHRAIP